MRHSLGALILLCAAAPLLAQTDTLLTGAVADSSIAGPIMVWNRIAADGDSTTFALNGWTMSWEAAHRVAPPTRMVVSVALTPLHARSSNRVYLAGERSRALEFDDSSIEATFGRIDTIGERWTSDIRAVAAYDRVSRSDQATRSFWSSPYAGVRTRQAYRHITAEDPLLLTFEGSEVRADAEVFAGKETWSRVTLSQRMSRRRGRFLIGESASVFHGRSLNTVNAFLAGASWPIGDLRPLYGYRYAELRLDRGAAAGVDAQVALRRSFALGAHANILRSRQTTALGVAADASFAWRGVGIRVGVARPFEEGRRGEGLVIYGSVLAARFIGR